MSRLRFMALTLAGITMCSFMVYMLSVEYAYSDNNPNRHKMLSEYYLPDKILSTPSISDEELLSRQARRRQQVKEVCSYLLLEKKTSDLPRQELDHIIVDDVHRLLYCYVPKVACTNWKRIMLILTKKSGQSPLDIPANDSHQLHKFRTLDTYSEDEIEYKLRNYMKFLFVRHPFERILSAYRNKFQQNYSTYFHNRFGRTIVRKYRTNPSAESLERGHDVTFEEFVRYLIDEQTLKEGRLNEHWRPVFQLCHPCRIDYDMIGKYETLAEDARNVLQRAHVNHLVKFPVINKTFNTAELVKDYFANISEAQAVKAFHLYALDFTMFGYHHENLEKYFLQN